VRLLLKTWAVRKDGQGFYDLLAAMPVTEAAHAKLTVLDQALMKTTPPRIEALNVPGAIMCSVFWFLEVSDVLWPVRISFSRFLGHRGCHLP
jgi:hypothetical protein